MSNILPVSCGFSRPAVHSELQIVSLSTVCLVGQLVVCSKKSYNEVIANDSMMQRNKVEPQ